MNGLGVLCYEAMPAQAAALDAQALAVVAAMAAAVRAALAPELARLDAAVSTRAAADQLMPADVRYVNGVLIGGTGAVGDTWGPAA